MTEEERTREGYDAIAPGYAEQFRDELAGKPLDRALLGTLAELVTAAGPVLDLGSGPGVVTAHLAGLGLETLGIDLSPRTVELARRHHPHLRFEVGSMLGLDLPDASCAGAVASYSIIHLAPHALPTALRELGRVLVPGAPLLLAFQTGGPTMTLTNIDGTGACLDFRRHAVDAVAEHLREAGLTVTVRVLREPAAGESTQHAYLLARRG